jgi:hypothetical protein
MDRKLESDILDSVAAEQSVAPDRAAILVLRDTAPLQAARQVNAVVDAAS